MAFIAKDDRIQLFLATTSTISKADKIGKVTSIGDVASTKEEVDVTTLEDASRVFESGFNDNGSLEITQNLTTSEYTDMATLQENETEVKLGLALLDKEGEIILGLRCAKAKVLTVTLGGMSVGGIVTVVTSIKLNDSLKRDFTIPTTWKLLLKM